MSADEKMEAPTRPTMAAENAPTTPLLDAIKSGSAGALSNLLARRVPCPPAELNDALRLAARIGASECVKLLVPISDPKSCDSEALRWAARSGHAACVKLLTGVSNPKAQSSQALCQAAEEGHYECVTLLIPESEIEDVSDALAFAAGNGHQECVKLLIPASASTAKRSASLILAAIYGHAECARLLIPFCDATADGSRAFREAALNGHASCVDIFNRLAPAAFALIDLGALGAEAE